MSDFNLSPEQRLNYRKALRNAGQSARGLSDAELSAAYHRLTDAPLPAEPAPVIDNTPEPEPAPVVIPENVTPINDDSAAKLVALIKGLLPEPVTAPAVDEKQLVALIEKHATKTLEIVPAPDVEKITIKGAHKALEDCVTLASVGINIQLVGPAGSGKTTLAMQIAKALDRPFYSNGSVHAPYELTGVRTAHGDYVRSAFREAFEHGGVFLLDEADSSNARALNTFNQALDNDRYQFPDAMVDRHADFIAIMGCNTIGKGATRQYVGRTQLDDATLDRFQQIVVDYDLKLEETIGATEYKRHGGKDDSVYTAWFSRVLAVRQKLETMGAPIIVSPRATRDGAKVLAKGMTIERASELILYKHLSADQKKQVKGSL